MAPWMFPKTYPNTIPVIQAEKSTTTNRLSKSLFCVPYSSKLWMRSRSIVSQNQIAKNTGSKIVPLTIPISVDLIKPAVSSGNLKLVFQFIKEIIYSTKSEADFCLVKKMHLWQICFQAKTRWEFRPYLAGRQPFFMKKRLNFGFFARKIDSVCSVSVVRLP